MLLEAFQSLDHIIHCGITAASLVGIIENGINLGSLLHIYDRHHLPSLCLSTLPNVVLIHLIEQVRASRRGGSPIVPRDTYFYRGCFSWTSFHLCNVSADIIVLFAPSLLILGEV